MGVHTWFYKDRDVTPMEEVESISRLLGTRDFSIAYGISNTSFDLKGQLSGRQGTAEEVEDPNKG